MLGYISKGNENRILKRYLYSRFLFIIHNSQDMKTNCLSMDEWIKIQYMCHKGILSGYEKATWCLELTHLKRPWCWERLKAGEGDDRGWDGWMASLSQWTWVWVDSGSWWWTGRPGVLWFIRSQSQTRLSNWTELNSTTRLYC